MADEDDVAHPSEIPTKALARDAATIGSHPPALEQIGPYRLIKIIGEGGFGTVYLAEQEHPVRRRVALKIIKPGMDSRQVIARFEAERQALALMDHPNVARVYDAGATESGRLYFAMELVAGIPITRYCDQHALAIEQRLELFIQVCQGVQHAHTKGLIHRDLKPSNVLVGSTDGRPAAKVIDFGIAKATQARLTERTLYTEIGQLIGTPEYMSPEQAEGSLDIDTRSDVYSLGVVLYELLTGAPPFETRELRSNSYADLQRIICEVDPPKPSARLSAMAASLPPVAAQRALDPRRLQAQVRGELDWIVMKCLEKDRQRRYLSAATLAADVAHYLADEPVAAAAPSRLYRIGKFVRRHKAMVLAAGAVLVALVAGTVGTTIGLVGQARQRAEAQTQASIAQAVSRFQSNMLASADPEKLLGDKVTVLQAVTAAVTELDAGRLKDQPLAEAGVRMTIGNTLRSLGRYDAAVPNLRKALELRRASLPPGDPEIGSSLNDLAVALLKRGNLDEAEGLYREAVSIERNSLHPRPREVAAKLSNLAQVLMTKGNLDEAETMHREALAIQRAMRPPPESDIASTLNDLAFVQQNRGKYTEAEPLFREALDILRRTLPPGHPAIATGLLNLGLLLYDQNRLSEAEALLREGLEIGRQALPHDHPEMASMLASLGAVLQAQGRLDEAERLHREALEIRRRILPPTHPDIAVSLDNIASVLQDRGDLVGAEALLREALEIRRKSLPEGHPLIAVLLNNLGSVARARGDLAAAEALHREALAMRRKAFPAGHPDIAQSLNNLAYVVRAQGRLIEAEPMFREAVATNEATYGKDDWITGNARFGLGRTLAAMNRFTDAEAELLAAERILAAAEGAPPERHQQCVEGLAEMYAAWDKAERGRGHAASAAQWKARLAAGPK
jgi:serine/threonine protein kinase/Flp pilus assembly protein TadD